MTKDGGSGLRLGFYLLLAPLALWLVLLVLLPQVDMLMVSLRVKVGIRQYETGLSNYMEFLPSRFTGTRSCAPH